MERVEKVRDQAIGHGRLFQTAFGARPLVYADYTASGRSVQAIEDFITARVMPWYANTHSESSFTGAQTTLLREQARDEIRRSVRAGEDHKVIFCGAGATAAINKAIDILNIRLPADLNKQHDLEAKIPESEKPVVFIASYEHHSNELPWRECIATLVVIPLTKEGQLDLNFLEEQLKKYDSRKLKIGSFSAASNVTGLKTDTAAVSKLLHNHGGLAFWDYAAAGPYVSMDMKDKDALFLSPHKFIGGPGTPGILIIRKSLLTNTVPAVPGGGTVIYVNPESHRYLADPERREEGGTPAIIESIRAGLVFKLKNQVGEETIEKLEQDFIQRGVSRWGKHPNIEILGNPNAPRLAITSMRIKYQRKKDLHYGFVVVLLNDLFGIQARGGCSCAGPYGHTLLHMSMEYSAAIEEEVIKGASILRPGWIRLSFNYFIGEDAFEYLVRAVELIADHGWRLLPYYQFDSCNGIWRYQGRQFQPVAALDDFDFMHNMGGNGGQGNAVAKSLSEYLVEGEKELLKDRSTEPKAKELVLSKEAEALRWFVLPHELQV